MAETSSAGKRRPPMFMCGTSKEDCTGSICSVNHGLNNGKVMAHGSRDQAFNCHKKALLKQGYVQIDSRAFRAPDDRPTVVLTKKAHFGSMLRNGKEGTRNQPMGHRNGVIVG